MTALAWLTFAAVIIATATTLATIGGTRPATPPRVLHGGELSTDEGWQVLNRWRDEITPESDPALDYETLRAAVLKQPEDYPSAVALIAAIEAEKALTDDELAAFIDKETP